MADAKARHSDFVIKHSRGKGRHGVEMAEERWREMADQNTASRKFIFDDKTNKRMAAMRETDEKELQYFLDRGGASSKREQRLWLEAKGWLPRGMEP